MCKSGKTSNMLYSRHLGYRTEIGIWFSVYSLKIANVQGKGKGSVLAIALLTSADM